MKKFVIATATCGGDMFITFMEGNSAFEVLEAYAIKEDYGFRKHDDYNDMMELQGLFWDCDQSVEIKEIPSSWS